MTEYRVGNHQPQNVYRGDAYIGVMFTAEDAALVTLALNVIEGNIAKMPPHPTCIDVTRIGEYRGSSWVCGANCPALP